MGYGQIKTPFMELYEELCNTFDFYEFTATQVVKSQPLRESQAVTKDKPSIEQYFNEITSSREAVINFIKNELTKYKSGSGFISKYFQAIINETSIKKASEITDLFNYRAFLNALESFGLSVKDLKNIYLTGEPLPTAESLFVEKTASAEAVKDFMRQLYDEYNEKFKNNSSRNASLAYTQWFTNYSNAINPNGLSLIPESVNWNNFVQVCTNKFNYTVSDLVALYRGNYTGITKSVYTVEDAIKYFNEITSSKEAIESFLKEKVAPYVKARKTFDVSSSYHSAFAKEVKTSAIEIGRNAAVNYAAFKDILFTDFGYTKKDIFTLIKSGNEHINPNLNLRKNKTSIARDLPKAERPTLEAYFKDITKDRESAITFIQNRLAAYEKNRARPNTAASYTSIITADTNTSEMSEIYNSPYNYPAFKQAILKYDITAKDIKDIIEASK